MLKKATLPLLLWLVIGIVTPLATIQANGHYFFYNQDDCPVITIDQLSAFHISDTSVTLQYQEQIGRPYSQFRLRIIGEESWTYTSIQKADARNLVNLFADTLYEFQASYVCTDKTWVPFSESVYFTTTGAEITDNNDNNSKEEEEEQEEDPPTVAERPIDFDMPTLIDSTLILSVEGAFASCGDSLLCTEVISSSLDSIHMVLLDLQWDTNALLFSSIHPNAAISDSLHSQFQVMVDTNRLSVSWEHSSPLDSHLIDNVSLFSVCFQPVFSDSITSPMMFGDSIAFVKGFDSLATTVWKPLTEIGTIQLYQCDSIQLGGGTCFPTDGAGLTTNTVTETAAYIQNNHPDASLNNQFRYRVKGTSNWRYTSISNFHFRRIVDLLPGTVYEFQANVECGDSTFSDYSISHDFTTQGVTNEQQLLELDLTTNSIVTDSTCLPVSADELYVSTIKQYFAYVYTPQPYGAIKNQFRYRVVGEPFWLHTNVSSTYYRWLSGLRDGTLYEYQVSHECQPNAWSDFSESYLFETLPSINLAEKATSRVSPSGTTTPTIQSEVVLYPNPSMDVINFAVGQAFDKKQLVSIVDRNGRVLLQETLSAGQRQMVFHIATFPAGLYVVRFQSDAGMQFVKFMKR